MSQAKSTVTLLPVARWSDLMLDFETEELLDLATACREKCFRNPKTGKPCHIASMFRHVNRGAKAANGEKIRLETIRTPSGVRTSREAIRRFITALTNPDEPLSPPRTAARRQQIAAAEIELQAAGFAM